MSGNALFMFLHVRCRGHLGRGRVRCQRRHLSIACDISSGRRTDVPAKCWGPCASKVSKLDCSAHLAVVLNQFKTLCWTRTSRLGLNCSGDVATQAVYMYEPDTFRVYITAICCLQYKMESKMDPVGTNPLQRHNPKSFRPTMLYFFNK